MSLLGGHCQVLWARCLAWVGGWSKETFLGHYLPGGVQLLHPMRWCTKSDHGHVLGQHKASAYVGCMEVSR